MAEITLKDTIDFKSDKQEEYFDILTYEGWEFDSQIQDSTIIMVLLGNNEDGICVDKDCYIRPDGFVQINDFD